MSKIRKTFSVALTAMRVAGFIATIALHGGDVRNIVCTGIHLALQATATRS